MDVSIVWCCEAVENGQSSVTEALHSGPPTTRNIHRIRDISCEHSVMILLNIWIILSVGTQNFDSHA